MAASSSPRAQMCSIDSDMSGAHATSKRRLSTDNVNDEVKDDEEDEEIDSDDNGSVEEEVKVDPHYRRNLAATLKSVDRVGCFSFSGVLSAPFPAIEIDGIGRLAYPLWHQQAAAIIQQCAAPAPTPVASGSLATGEVCAWQVGAERFKFVGKERWLASQLPKIVKLACEGLGLNVERLGITASLRRMMLFEMGGSSAIPRHTEPSAGMFGTLVVQLPAQHTGGDLVVELDHGKHQSVARLSDDSADQMAFACFFADCEHSMQPLESGRRLVLEFDLRMRQPSAFPLPTGSAMNGVSLKLIGIRLATKEWMLDPNAPAKLAIPLRHKWSGSSGDVSLDDLEGDDKEMFRTLTAATVAAAAPEKLLTVHVVLAEKVDRGRGLDTSEEYDDEDEYEDDEDDTSRVKMGMVLMSELKPLEWITAQGEVKRLDLPLHVTSSNRLELVDVNGDLDVFGKPVSTEFVGNDHTLIEQTHRAAILVIWPRVRAMDVRLLAGQFTKVLDDAEEGLDELVDSDQMNEDEDNFEAVVRRQEAADTVDLIVDSVCRHPDRILKRHASALARLFAVCKPERIPDLLCALSAVNGIYHPCLVVCIAGLLHRLPWRSISRTVRRVVSDSAMQYLKSAQRLIEAVADLPEVHDALLGTLVAAVSKHAAAYAPLWVYQNAEMLIWLGRQALTPTAEEAKIDPRLAFRQSLLAKLCAALLQGLEGHGTHLTFTLAEKALLALTALYGYPHPRAEHSADARQALERWAAACKAQLTGEALGQLLEMPTTARLYDSNVDAVQSLQRAIPAAAVRQVPTSPVRNYWEKGTYSDLATALMLIHDHSNDDEADSFVRRAVWRQLQANDDMVVNEPFHALASADVAHLWTDQPAAPVWSAMFNHQLFERHVMRIIADFAVTPPVSVVRSILDLFETRLILQSPGGSPYLRALRAGLSETLLQHLFQIPVGHEFVRGASLLIMGGQRALPLNQHQRRRLVAFLAGAPQQQRQVFLEEMDACATMQELIVAGSASMVELVELKMEDLLFRMGLPDADVSLPADSLVPRPINHADECDYAAEADRVAVGADPWLTQLLSTSDMSSIESQPGLFAGVVGARKEAQRLASQFSRGPLTGCLSFAGAGVGKRAHVVASKAKADYGLYMEQFRCHRADFLWLAERLAVMKAGAGADVASVEQDEDAEEENV